MRRSAPTPPANFDPAVRATSSSHPLTTVAVMDARPALGRLGEDAAADLYVELGFEIVERNYRCVGGEIDVIATDGKVLVFCEVKTRRTDRWGDPSEAVGYRKQQRLRRLAATWLAERRAGLPVRFDVISILADGNGLTIEHLPDAF